jgi:fused signal recognition particle receptor
MEVMMLKFFGGKKTPAIPEPTQAEDAAPAAKTSLFDRMKQAVSRTRESLSERIEDLVALTRTVDEDAIERLEAALLASDLGLPTTTDLLNAVRARAKREDIDGAGLRAILREELLKILAAPIKTPLEKDSAEGASHTQVLFLVGVNGTGKTTTSGKLAAWFRAEGRTVLLCAADTFRAAAIEQLEVWARRSGVELIKTQMGADPASVLYDAAAAAKARNIDLLIVDTAGRLHTKSGLMDELEKMSRTAAKLISGAPHEVLLVMDATTGQNGLQQARLFTQIAGVTGIVLTKLDGTAKGGIAVAIAREMNLPVRFVGVGEKLEDLLEFDASAFVDSLLS